MMDKFKILVKTGNQERAGTDANVLLVLEDEHGIKCPELKLDLPYYDDLERGTLDKYTQVIPATFGNVKKIYLSRDQKGHSDDWFCDYIIVQDPRGLSDNCHRTLTNNTCPQTISGSIDGFKPEIYFPICRWVTSKHVYEFNEYATCLPNQDLDKYIRKLDLEEIRKSYYFVQNIPEGPSQAAMLPSDEKFSDQYYFTFATDKIALLAKTTFIHWTMRKWKSVDELKRVYKKCFGEPDCLPHWRDDYWFGWQRLQGVNPLLLKLCTKIPDKFDVTEETITGLLDNVTLATALKENKIFICDLEILDGIPCKDGRILAAPLALFYLNGNQTLLPIAIQLKQQKGPDNPVFTPHDPKNTWLVAKMFYNNAEAQHHQGISHLGLTHLLMEGICLCTHRNLSPSHPMFKLMAPHFLYLIAINTRGLDKLISPGGWVDGCMTSGVEGIYEVIRRGMKSYNFYSYGNIGAELKSRGVHDKKILPYYPYRDDALSLFDIIRKYVDTVVHNHYDSIEKLEEDWELKDWRQELSLEREKGGVGLEGVPGDNNKGFTSIEELVETIAIIICTCSVGHAASNFQQYHQYAFIPNYPGILSSDPPIEKTVYDEDDIVNLLPDMKTTLETIVITKLLSSRGTNSLGNFEMQYLYRPDDVEAANEFRKELKKLSLVIKIRNIDRQFPFGWLDPDIIPNAISI